MNDSVNRGFLPGGKIGMRSSNWTITTHGFTLSKWISNCLWLVEGIHDKCDDVITIQHESASPVLRIQWDKTSDIFHFLYNLVQKHVVSKQTMLSEISRLFDLLGLLRPVTSLAKRILQELLQENIYWDESIPANIHSRWIKLRAQFFKFQSIENTLLCKIFRRVKDYIPAWFLWCKSKRT